MVTNWKHSECERQQQGRESGVALIGEVYGFEVVERGIKTIRVPMRGDSLGIVSHEHILCLERFTETNKRCDGGRIGRALVDLVEKTRENRACTAVEGVQAVFVRQYTHMPTGRRFTPSPGKRNGRDGIDRNAQPVAKTSGSTRSAALQH